VSERDRPNPARRRTGDVNDTDDAPVLPETTRDEHEPGWGDEREERDADWYHRERPPHHE
jgi:hypothetical protein